MGTGRGAEPPVPREGTRQSQGQAEEGTDCSPEEAGARLPAPPGKWWHTRLEDGCALPEYSLPSVRRPPASGRPFHSPAHAASCVLVNLSSIHIEPFQQESFQQEPFHAGQERMKMKGGSLATERAAPPQARPASCRGAGGLKWAQSRPLWHLLTSFVQRELVGSTCGPLPSRCFSEWSFLSLMPFFLRILACFYSLWVAGGQNERIWFKKIWFCMA